MIESWFWILTRQYVRRGTYASVTDLIHAIERSVAGYKHAQPFLWTEASETEH